MTNKETGGPAFPTGTGWDHKGDWIGGGDDGMTMRDYFAAKAMQSLLELHDDVMKITDQDGFVSLHIRAYEHADAMLKARGQ